MFLCLSGSGWWGDGSRSQPRRGAHDAGPRRSRHGRRTRRLYGPAGLRRAQQRLHEPGHVRPDEWGIRWRTGRIHREVAVCLLSVIFVINIINNKVGSWYQIMFHPQKCVRNKSEKSTEVIRLNPDLHLCLSSATRPTPEAPEGQLTSLRLLPPPPSLLLLPRQPPLQLQPSLPSRRNKTRK